MSSLNQNIIFDLPEETDLVDVIYNILEKNQIKDDPDQWFEREKSGQDSQAVIIKHAAIVLFKKIAPDEKIAELLQKHLAISQEIAKNIIQDIKLKLVAYMKLDNAGTIPPGIKNPETKNVAENAKISEENKKYTQDTKEILQNNQPKPITSNQQNSPQKSDNYREPIE